ncbi:hypothetical protein SAMN05660464_4005 [Geodermatophilus dictyosporus]|uniref:PH domain-containing protein n=1 Tax=Geodermatophilus dictyosporus TaxID=1523247 RepID=A0A1I5SJZ5_9ACTN|nr:hypothetical protein SAMN05660464_4005 [Geodermatophilus dictyosporus]
MTTGATGVASAMPSWRRRVVGRHPGLAVLTACVVLSVFVLRWGLLARSLSDAGNLFEVLPPMCLLVTVQCLLDTCGLAVDPAGHVEVVEVRRVPVDDLVGIGHDDGLHLRLVSGRRIGSTAYGASLPGHLLNHPRSVRAARRIEAATGGLPDRASDRRGGRTPCGRGCGPAPS